MSEKRIIKKYPNRRLYDTAISSYITLEDVRRLIMESVSVHVIDAKTKADITHSTLLQIIVEQESKGNQLFSADILEQLIYAYGRPVQAWLKQYISQGMAVYAKQMAAHPNLEKDAHGNMQALTDWVTSFSRVSLTAPMQETEGSMTEFRREGAMD